MTRDIVRIDCMTKRPARRRTYGGVDAALREEDRRKKLVEAGLEAFGTQGYAKTNIKTICTLAGLTERYFYESFRHKEDLLCALYGELIEEQKSHALNLLEDTTIRPVEAAMRSLRMFYHRLQEDPRRARVQFFEILGVSPRVDREYQSAMRTLAEMVKLFLCRVFPEIPRETWKRSLIPTSMAGAMVQVSNVWMLDGFTMPLDHIISQLMDLFTAVGRHLAADLPTPKGPAARTVPARRRKA